MSQSNDFDVMTELSSVPILFNNLGCDAYLSNTSISILHALRHTTHLCIGAHQDDIEIMAYHGIAECYNHSDKHFTGVVVTDGGGSPRTGAYADVSNEEMKEIRKQEQRMAAQIGDYNLQLQLGYSSADVKQGSKAVLQDLITIFQNCSPEIVYLHQPTDRHSTHVAVCILCLNAIRLLPLERRPKKVVGCEVWGSLDWLVGDIRYELDTSKYPELAERLLSVYDSQISGGKRYDLATLGRRRANATYSQSHSVDMHKGITLAMDLTALAHDDNIDIKAFTLDLIDKFKFNVHDRLSLLLG